MLQVKDNASLNPDVNSCHSTNPGDGPSTLLPQDQLGESFPGASKHPTKPGSLTNTLIYL